MSKQLSTEAIEWCLSEHTGSIHDGAVIELTALKSAYADMAARLTEAERQRDDDTKRLEACIENDEKQISLLYNETRELQIQRDDAIKRGEEFNKQLDYIFRINPELYDRALKDMYPADSGKDGE